MDREESAEVNNRNAQDRKVSEKINDRKKSVDLKLNKE
jgi:hypothetical protein